MLGAYFQRPSTCLGLPRQPLEHSEPGARRVVRVFVHWLRLFCWSNLCRAGSGLGEWPVWTDGGAGVGPGRALRAEAASRFLDDRSSVQSASGRFNPPTQPPHSPGGHAGGPGLQPQHRRPERLPVPPPVQELINQLRQNIVTVDCHRPVCHCQDVGAWRGLAQSALHFSPTAFAL